jgi:hypothetical protein
MRLAHLLWRLNKGRTGDFKRTYRAFVTKASKSWLATDDRAQIRQGREISMRKVRDAVQIIELQTAVIPALQVLWGKLVVLTTMTENDLKTTV